MPREISVPQIPAGKNSTQIMKTAPTTSCQCTVQSETKVGGLPAILPTIEGRAWVTGFHHYVVDPTDPWPVGYRLSDTWSTSDIAIILGGAYLNPLGRRQRL